MLIELTPGQEKLIAQNGENPDDFRNFSTQQELSFALQALKRRNPSNIPANTEAFKEKRKKAIQELGLELGMHVRGQGSYERKNSYVITRINPETGYVFVKGIGNEICVPPYHLIPIDTPSL